jgi:hypothetical protein
MLKRAIAAPPGRGKAADLTDMKNAGIAARQPVERKLAPPRRFQKMPPAEGKAGTTAA